MPLEFSTTDRESTAHGIKMLVYGRAGMGKTTLCGTAPSPIIISAEAGLLSLAGKAIPVIKVKSIQDVWDAYTWCAANAANHNIKTICLDSISEIVEKVLETEKKKNRDPRAAFGEMATEAIKLVKMFRDLSGFHVLVTAKETTVVDPITNVTRAQPTAPGQQVGPALPYLFDEVFHAATGKDTQGKTYHYLRTHASFDAEAKDRSGKLDEVEWPNIEHLIGKIIGTNPNQGI